MEMKPIHSGRLRAIGYDAKARLLAVQLDNGDTLQYRGIGSELWHRLSSASSPWSVYRDTIEEEFSAERVARAQPAAKPNPLDDLFKR